MPSCGCEADDWCKLFFSTCTAAPRPCALLPELIQLIWDHEIDRGKVFDPTFRLQQAAAGYQAMDERQAIKVLLTLRPDDRADGVRARHLRGSTYDEPIACCIRRDATRD